MAEDLGEVFMALPLGISWSDSRAEQVLFHSLRIKRPLRSTQ